MANNIQNAIKGQRKAMNVLYANNKQKIFYISKILLNDESQANEVTAVTFRNIWKNITSNKVETEQQFSALATRIALEECKKRVLKKNSKAYRVPDNRNFVLPSLPLKYFSDKKFEEFVFDQLTDLQKLIFVAHNIVNCDKNTISAITKLDTKTLDMALEAEKINIEKIITTTEQSYSYNNVVKYFTTGELNQSVPTQVNDMVNASIDAIAKPIEKRKATNITIISIVSVLVCVCIVLGIIFIPASFNKSSTTDESVADTSATVETTEASTLETTSEGIGIIKNPSHYATIDIEDYGTIEVALDESTAPETVKNFVELAESGFYDGLKFHRIMEDFMMQGGDPSGDGTGGSEKNIKGEFRNNGVDNPLSHTKGAISMARSNDYNSASSQFFICHADATFLDGDYAVFGYVTKGFDVVDKVCVNSNPTDDNGTIPEDEKPVIRTITIKKAK